MLLSHPIPATTISLKLYALHLVRLFTTNGVINRSILPSQRGLRLRNLLEHMFGLGHRRLHT